VDASLDHPHDFRLIIKITEPVRHRPRRPHRVPALVTNIQLRTGFQLLRNPLQALDALEHRRGPDRAQPLLDAAKRMLPAFSRELAPVAAGLDAEHSAAVIDDNQPARAGMKQGFHFLKTAAGIAQ
jgi:hypothetical protein